ncbi:MAG: YerC/YecD family TrpR-related protein [Candidatus Doudnabacteria bacterium]
MPQWDNKKTEDLFQAILALKNIKEAKRFFRDLLTEQEIVEFSRRWQAAKMLNGKVAYSAIEKKTGLSSTTIARISKWLNRGMGGYRLIIKRLNHHASFSHGEGLRWRNKK